MVVSQSASHRIASIESVSVLDHFYVHIYTVVVCMYSSILSTLNVTLRLPGCGASCAGDQNNIGKSKQIHSTLYLVHFPCPSQAGVCRGEGSVTNCIQVPLVYFQVCPPGPHQRGGDTKRNAPNRLLGPRAGTYVYWVGCVRVSLGGRGQRC